MLFYVLFVCKCVLPPGDNPIAVNKYTNINKYTQYSVRLEDGSWSRTGDGGSFSSSRKASIPRSCPRDVTLPAGVPSSAQHLLRDGTAVVCPPHWLFSVCFVLMALRASSCNLHVTFKFTPWQHWNILGQFSDRGCPGTYQFIILGFRNRRSRIGEVQKQINRRLCLPNPYFMGRQVGIG